MKACVSSSGVYYHCAERYITLVSGNGVRIALLDRNSHRDDALPRSPPMVTEEADDLLTVQHIAHPPPLNILWSENSAHLVVITGSFIYLYCCVHSGHEVQRWRWELERKVESPRDLTGFHATYCHPLLSLERKLVSDPQHSNSAGELVVINLLCSLFQTFSIANIQSAPVSKTRTCAANTANKLSCSGRYLCTTQALTNPQGTTTTLSLRIYDLQSLWVLQSPQTASYLDFRYADLPVQTIQSAAHRHLPEGPHNLPQQSHSGDGYSIGSEAVTVGGISASTAANTDIPIWDLQQLQWRRSDGYTIGPDGCEILFVSKLQRGGTQNTIISTPVRPASIGIADSSDLCDEIVLTDSATAGSYQDVVVSIYAISQQPDYEHITIMTMAYNAAIVAGQISDDPYAMSGTALSQGASRDNLSGLVTPNYSTSSLPYTTVVQLLTTVSLSALLREPSPATAGVDIPIDGSVYVCWVEPECQVSVHPKFGTHRAHTAGKGKKSTTTIGGGGSALQLAVQYPANMFATGKDGGDHDAGAASQAALNYVVVSVRHNGDAETTGSTTLGGGAAAVMGYLATVSARSGCNAVVLPPKLGAQLVRTQCRMIQHAGHTSTPELPNYTYLSEYQVVHGDTSNDAANLLTEVVLRASATEDSGQVREESSVLRWRTLLLPQQTSNASERSPSEQCARFAVALQPSSNAGLTAIEASRNLYSVQDVSDKIGWSSSQSILNLGALATTLRSETSNVSVLSVIQVSANASDMRRRRQYLYLLYKESDANGTVTHAIALFQLDDTTQCAAAARTGAALKTATATLLAAHSQPTALWHQRAAAASRHSEGTAAPIAVAPIEYVVDILPDPHFGLGIRIDVLDGRTVVSSFKKHPITNKAMSAQLTGHVQPGDEFLAINGQPLRGLSLSEVIHTIRTTVSEGGDRAVTLTMRRSVPVASASSDKLHSGLTPSLHTVSSTNSIPSTASINSLSDGLGPALPAAGAPTTAVPMSVTKSEKNVEDPESDRSPEMPLLTEWRLVATTTLPASVVSADLSIAPTDPTAVWIAALHEDDAAEAEGARITLYSVSNPKVQQLSVVEISQQRLTMPQPCPSWWQLQLWPRKRTEKQQCSVLSSRLGDSLLPTLQVCNIQTSPNGAVRFSPSTEYSLIAIDKQIAAPAAVAVPCGEPCVLLDQPRIHSVTRIMSATTGNCNEIFIRHADRADRVPLSLPQNNVLSCTVTPIVGAGSTKRAIGVQAHNPLESVLRLLNVLSTSNGAVKTTSDSSNVPLVQPTSVEQVSDGVWSAGNQHYHLPPLAEAAIGTLRAVGGDAPTALTVEAVRTAMLGEVQLDAYAMRVVVLQRLLITMASTSQHSADSCTPLSGAAVANLLFASRESQGRMLQRLLTSCVAVDAGQTMPLVRCPQEADILTLLTHFRVPLWLRDLTPLVEIVQKHALATFKKKKSSIQVFLEMVLIGKEDTLLQLAKTDKEKSGRQLLALLTLDDTFTSEKTRKSLQKNAFALMKLRRYRDAAAVFLLADPPYIKEAASVLAKQHGEPLLALLVTRLAEHRQSVRRAATVTAAGAPQSVSTYAAGSDGYALGSASRQLLQSDILPDLLQVQKLNSLCSKQQAQTKLSTVSAHNSLTADTPTSFQDCDGSGGMALCLVCALWLQNRQLLSDTFSEVCRRYSLVDAAIATGAGRTATAAAEVTEALAAMDWVLEVAAYVGPQQYHAALSTVQELLVQVELHHRVLQLPLFKQPPALTQVLDAVRKNAFLQHCRACHEHYRSLLTLSLLPPPSPLGNAVLSSADTSMPGTPAIMTGADTPVPSSTLGEEDPEYAAILKRVARFQASTVPVPGAVAGAVATATVAVGGIARLSPSPADAPTSPATTPSSAQPAGHSGGGFNFARTATTSGSNSGSIKTTAAPAPAVDILSAFDLPPAAPRRSTAQTISTTSANTSTGRRDPGRRGAALDLLGDTVDMFPPAPARPLRPAASTPSSAPGTPSVGADAVQSTDRPVAAAQGSPGAGDGISAEAAAASEGGSQESVAPAVKPPSLFNLTASTSNIESSSQNKAATASALDAIDAFDVPARSAVVPGRRVGGAGGRGGSGGGSSGSRGGASLDLLGDALDFPPPQRHTRASLAPQPTRQVPSSARSGQNNGESVIASVEQAASAAASNDAPARPDAPDTDPDKSDYTPVGASFNFAKSNKSSSGGQQVRSALEDFDVFSAPPVRHQRTKPTSQPSSDIANASVGAQAEADEGDVAEEQEKSNNREA